MAEIPATTSSQQPSESLPRRSTRIRTTRAAENEVTLNVQIEFPPLERAADRDAQDAPSFVGKNFDWKLWSFFCAVSATFSPQPVGTSADHFFSCPRLARIIGEQADWLFYVDDKTSIKVGKVSSAALIDVATKYRMTAQYADQSGSCVIVVPNADIVASELLPECTPVIPFVEFPEVLFYPSNWAKETTPVDAKISEKGDQKFFDAAVQFGLCSLLVIPYSALNKCCLTFCREHLEFAGNPNPNIFAPLVAWGAHILATCRATDENVSNLTSATVATILQKDHSFMDFLAEVNLSQAQRTMIFKNLDEQKKVEIEAARKLREERAKFEKERATLEAERADLQEAKDGLEAEVRTLQGKIRALFLEIQNPVVQSRLSGYEQRIADLEAEIKILKAQRSGHQQL